MSIKEQRNEVRFPHLLLSEIDLEYPIAEEFFKLIIRRHNFLTWDYHEEYHAAILNNNNSNNNNKHEDNKNNNGNNNNDDSSNNIKEGTNLDKEVSSEDQLNIVIIVFDSVSHAHAQRSLSKTYRYLEDHPRTTIMQVRP